MIGNNLMIKNGLLISVDWLSFTIKKDMIPDDVIFLFGLDPADFEKGLNGSYGYKSRIRHFQYPISILFDGNDNMGIHVDVSGSAIAYFIDCYRLKHTDCLTPFGGFAYSVDSFDQTVLCDLLQEVFDLGRITRLDIAIDDPGCQYYSLAELTDIFNEGLYLSKFKKWKLNLEKNKAGTVGHTIYFGSRTSEIMFRIYDKRLEQIARKSCDQSADPWVRWELELHKNRATAVAMFLIAGNDLPSVAVGILSSYIRLIVRDKPRDSRCTNSKKWNSFICGIQKVKLCQPVPERTLKEKRDWVVRQVAPTLSAIYEIDGDLSFFYDAIEKGSFRYSRELVHIIQLAERGELP